MAFEVEGVNRNEVMDYLREREQVTNVYFEVQRNVRLASGRDVFATSFAVNQSHEQFSGNLTHAEQLAMVQNAQGEAGSNRDYVLNTVAHLEQLHIVDRHLHQLAEVLALET